MECIAGRFSGRDITLHRDGEPRLRITATALEGPQMVDELPLRDVTSHEVLHRNVRARIVRNPLRIGIACLVVLVAAMAQHFDFLMLGALVLLLVEWTTRYVVDVRSDGGRGLVLTMDADEWLPLAVALRGYTKTPARDAGAA